MVKTSLKSKLIVAGIVTVITAGSVITFNQITKSEITKNVKHALIQETLKVKKSTAGFAYPDFTKSKIKCSGFFNYTCKITNNYFRLNNLVMHGNFAEWDMKIKNLNFEQLTSLKNRQIKNLDIEISNLKPTTKASILFNKKMFNYTFPINIGSQISFSKKAKYVAKKVGKENKTLYTRKVILKDTYFDNPTLKLKLNMDLTLQDVNNGGFFIYLDKNNNFITDKNKIKKGEYKSQINLAANDKIILHKAKYSIEDKHIADTIYLWYTNVGGKQGFAALNSNIFYIQNPKKLTRKEFDKQIKKVFSGALSSISNVKTHPKYKWFKQELEGMEKMYFKKIKGVSIQISNKSNIPLQASYVIGRINPGVLPQIKFLDTYYNIKVKEIK